LLDIECSKLGIEYIYAISFAKVRTRHDNHGIDFLTNSSWRTEEAPRVSLARD